MAGSPEPLTEAQSAELVEAAVGGAMDGASRRSIWVASEGNPLLVRETTPLEPGVVDHKIYVRGIGTVREETVKGGRERFALVSVRQPAS